MEYEFVPSQRGKMKLVARGYVYRHSRTRGTNHYFRCERQNCAGTAILREAASYDATTGRLEEGLPHGHDPEEGRAAILKMKFAIRKEASKSAAPPRAIVQQHRQEIPIKAAANLPSEDALRQMAQRARREGLPQEPTTRGEIVIPDSLSKTIEGDNFILADTFDPLDGEMGADDGDHRIIVMGTEDNLKRLSETNMWFIDGTFRTCPPQFQQLYTVNALVDGACFPLVFVLMPGKSQFLYRSLFTELKQAAQAADLELNPEYIMSDFELAAINAARLEFPDAKIHACHFHLAQSVHRRVLSEGLRNAYRNDENVALSVKKLIALSFLEPLQIPAAFDVIREQCPDSVRPVYRYFEDTYVRGRQIVPRGKGRRPRVLPRHPPMFPPELWSVHELVVADLARTNNLQEAWHRRFNALVGRAHQGVFPTMREFQKEQHRTDQELRRLDHGEAIPRKRLTQDQERRERRIRRLFDNRQELDLNTFVRRLGRNMPLMREESSDENGSDSEDGDERQEEADHVALRNILFP